MDLRWQRHRNLPKPLGKGGQRNLVAKTHSLGSPDLGESVHVESETVNMRREMSACWFPYKETPAGVEKTAIMSTHREWEKAGGRQLWSRGADGDSQQVGGWRDEREEAGKPAQGTFALWSSFPGLCPWRQRKFGTLCGWPVAL